MKKWLAIILTIIIFHTLTVVFSSFTSLSPVETGVAFLVGIFAIDLVNKLGIK